MSQFVGHQAREPPEAPHRLDIRPAAHLFDPQRIGEVMQCHERFHPVLAQRRDHLLVVVKRSAIELAALWLDAAPLH